MPAEDRHAMLTPLLWLPICFSELCLCLPSQLFLGFFYVCLSVSVSLSVFLGMVPCKGRAGPGKAMGTVAAASRLSPVLQAPSQQPPGIECTQ